MVLGLVLTLSSTSAFAGSYNFECTAFSLDKKSNEIYKLSMTRESAILDNYPGVVLDIVDPNIALTDGTQTYVNSKETLVVKAKVTKKVEITSLSGNIGPRQHDVDMYSVHIDVDRNGSKEIFVGSCTETSISTCGGNCD